MNICREKAAKTQITIVICPPILTQINVSNFREYTFSVSNLLLTKLNTELFGAHQREIIKLLINVKILLLGQILLEMFNPRDAAVTSNLFIGERTLLFAWR